MHGRADNVGVASRGTLSDSSSGPEGTAVARRLGGASPGGYGARSRAGRAALALALAIQRRRLDQLEVLVLAYAQQGFVARQRVAVLVEDLGRFPLVYAQ